MCCEEPSSCIIRAINKSSRTLHAIYEKHVTFGLLSQAERNKRLADLAMTQSNGKFCWAGEPMCLPCFSVAFGMCAKTLTEKLRLLSRGGVLLHTIDFLCRLGSSAQETSFPQGKFERAEVSRAPRELAEIPCREESER